jgi:PD-(D/E)XK endonuclease
VKVIIPEINLEVMSHFTLPICYPENRSKKGAALRAAPFILLENPKGPMIGHIPEIHAVGLTTRKARGEAAEAAFLAKAANLGFGVARVWGDSERYDFILDSGQKLWRVQVKSTQRFDGSRYIVKTRGATQAYTAEEIDFIAAYIVPETLWYVIRISLAASRGQMYVSPGGSRHFRHEKYREAWCQMACPRDEVRPSRLLVERQQDYPFDVCKLCNLKCPLKESAIELTRDRRGRWQKSKLLAEAGRGRRAP